VTDEPQPGCRPDVHRAPFVLNEQWPSLRKPPHPVSAISTVSYIQP